MARMREDQPVSDKLKFIFDLFDESHNGQLELWELTDVIEDHTGDITQMYEYCHQIVQSLDMNGDGKTHSAFSKHKKEPPHIPSKLVRPDAIELSRGPKIRERERVALETRARALSLQEECGENTNAGEITLSEFQQSLEREKVFVNFASHAACLSRAKDTCVLKRTHVAFTLVPNSITIILIIIEERERERERECRAPSFLSQSRRRDREALGVLPSKTTPFVVSQRGSDV